MMASSSGTRINETKAHRFLRQGNGVHSSANDVQRIILRLVLFFAVIYLSSGAFAQQLSHYQSIALDPVLEKQIIESDFIHQPLPLDTRHSAENRIAQQTVTASEPLEIKPSLSGIKHTGMGTIRYAKEDELELIFPARYGDRPRGSANDPDYATYGRCNVTFDLNGRDLSNYNRIALTIRPECNNQGVVNANIFLQTQDETPAAHLLNLKNHQPNLLFYDISHIKRKQALKICIYIDLKGQSLGGSDMQHYFICHLRLEQAVPVEQTKSWAIEKGIAYSMSGYLKQLPKTAITTLRPHEKFKILETGSGKTALSAPLKETTTKIGSFSVADFSKLRTSGSYQLIIGTDTTPSFHIGESIFTDAAWRLLNFIYCQRCGDAVKGIHHSCHHDLFSVHDGKKISYGGGWHDAGDLSQQTLQTADVAFALMEAALSYQSKNSALTKRLLEEARWGMDFVVKQRYGDGFRGSSMGLLHWTDAIVGTDDDITTVRTQNNAFDNYLYAAYEAFAAVHAGYSEKDSNLLRQIAIEDFQFAETKYQSDGFDQFPFVMEHTYNTSPCLFMAAASWSASLLYQLTGKHEYAEKAVKYFNYVMQCQEMKDNELRGYFYRDTSHRSIIHYIHQSREQIIAMALDQLCSTQPRHKAKRRWMESARQYGKYLRQIMPLTAPFGMMPSGVWQKEEYRDSSAFHSLHIWTDRNVYPTFDDIVSQGERLDDTRYLRRFPVWLTIFNGNETLLLSTGKAAAVLGRLLNDSTLLSIAAEQLYWTVGKNPFRQSLIYGEGHDFPSMDSFSSGEITGEIPVGICSDGLSDVPSWPSTNNACYKEVWLTSAGKFLSLIGELE